MSTPIPTRFSDDELRLIDELVAGGLADNRSAVIRQAVLRLAEAVRRERAGAAIAASYRRAPQSADEDRAALANAIAMTEAEPW